MIKYQMIKDVNLTEATGLSSIQRTPEGIAMGAVPGWSMLLDPEYADVGRETALNRAKGTYSVLNNGEFKLGEFPDSGETAFDASDSIFQLKGPGKTSWNPEEWTFFSVMHRTNPENAPGLFRRLARSNQPSETQGAVGVGLGQFTEPDGNTLAVIDGQGDTPSSPSDESVRIFHKMSPGNLDRTALVMYTFSVTAGLAIYVDGVQVARNADDRRPLTYGFNEGEWYMFQNWRAYFGMTGLLDIDLSLARNAGHRRAIEKFLMAKYGIPEGPQ